MAESFDGNAFRISIVNESGLYAIIFGSNKMEAKKFKKWVTAEVLPTIRRTGQYAVQQLSPAEMLLAQAQQMVSHEKKLREHEQQLLLLKLKQEEYDIRAQEANEVLNLLPKSDIPLLATNDRAAVNQLVRAYVVSKGTSYSAVWGRLYTELYYRYSYDAKTRSKNSGGKLKPLDCIERVGHLSNLYSIASSILI